MKPCIFLLAVAAGSLWAQEVRTFTFTKSAERMPMGIEQMMGGSIKGAPYSADVVTETIQVLPDGNRIVNRQTGFVARDSQGRTRNETAVSLMGPANNIREAMKLTMIHDPMAQVTYTIDANAKTVRKVSTGTIPDGVAMKRAAEQEHLVTTGAMTIKLDGMATGAKKLAIERAAAANVKKESLGTQVIEGVMADGTRTTETIPAGDIGNEKDIQVVNEVWIAQDLKAMVLSKRTDPRMGEMTYKLTNIQKAEPAASLFDVPSDYQVVDGPGNVMYLRTKE